MVTRPEKTSDLSGKFMRQPAVRFERILPGPIERVWEFLTETERLPGWFGHGVIEPPRRWRCYLARWPYSRSCHTVETTPPPSLHLERVQSGDEETHYPNPT